MWEAIGTIIAAIVGTGFAVYLRHRLSEPSAQIHEVTFQMDQRRDNRNGMVISVDLSTCNLQDIDCQVAAYFSDASGEPLRDLNDDYRSYDGEVSVGTSLTPSRREQHFFDVELFIPYAELHLTPGTHDLSLSVSLWRKATNQTLAKTTDYEWRFTYGQRRRSKRNA